MSNDETPDRYWVTGVSEVTDEKVYIRGYDLEDIVGNLPFTAAAYLLIEDTCQPRNKCESLTEC